MPGRPTRQRVVYNEENLGTNLPVATAVPDLADHPLGDTFINIYFVLSLRKWTYSVGNG